MEEKQTIVQDSAEIFEQIYVRQERVEIENEVIWYVVLENEIIDTRDLLSKTLDSEVADRSFTNCSKKVIGEGKIRAIVKELVEYDYSSPVKVRTPFGIKEIRVKLVKTFYPPHVVVTYTGPGDCLIEAHSKWLPKKDANGIHVIMSQIAYKVREAYVKADIDRRCGACDSAGANCRICIHSRKEVDHFFLTREKSPEDKAPSKTTYEQWQENRNWEFLMNQAFKEARRAAHEAERALLQNPDANVQFPDPTIECEILDYALSPECPPLQKLSLMETIRQIEGENANKNPVACALYHQAAEALGCFYDQPKKTEEPDKTEETDNADQYGW